MTPCTVNVVALAYLPSVIEATNTTSLDGIIHCPRTEFGAKLRAEAHAPKDICNETNLHIGAKEPYSACKLRKDTDKIQRHIRLMIAPISQSSDSTTRGYPRTPSPSLHQTPPWCEYKKR